MGVEGACADLLCFAEQHDGRERRPRHFADPEADDIDDDVVPGCVAVLTKAMDPEVTFL